MTVACFPAPARQGGGGAMPPLSLVGLPGALFQCAHTLPISHCSRDGMDAGVDSAAAPLWASRAS